MMWEHEKDGGDGEMNPTPAVRKEVLFYTQQGQFSARGQATGLSEEELCEEMAMYQVHQRTLRELDNTAADLDCRPGHVLVNEDPGTGNAMAGSYEGDAEKGRVQVTLLLGQGEFREDHYAVDDRYAHNLQVRTEEGKWLLIGTTIDRFDLDQSTRCQRTFPDR